MRTIEAVWEKRNLGTACREIYMEKGDSWDEVKEVLERMKEAYQVLFLPIDRSDLLLEVQNLGFQYIESNFDLKLKRCNMWEPPLFCRRALEHVSSRLMKDDDVSVFLERLREKDFFDKDKIRLDPFFSENASANRNYWRTRDYIEEGRALRIYDVIYGNSVIGYFILELKEKNVVEVYLSGLYPESREKSLGICVFGEETRVAVRLGAKLITAGVSLNNFSSLKIYQSLQYEISRATNIFVKHREESSCFKKENVILLQK